MLIDSVFSMQCEGAVCPAHCVMFSFPQSGHVPAHSSMCQRVDWKNLSSQICLCLYPVGQERQVKNAQVKALHS